MQGISYIVSLNLLFQNICLLWQGKQLKALLVIYRSIDHLDQLHHLQSIHHHHLLLKLNLDEWAAVLLAEGEEDMEAHLFITLELSHHGKTKITTKRQTVFMISFYKISLGSQV